MRKLSPAARVIVVAVAAIIGINLLLRTINSTAGGSNSGPSSSSYTTAPDGVAAYAELLERNGRSVERLRTKLNRTTIDPSTTLVVFGEFLDPEDSEALRIFVETGGRLVAAGGSAGQLVGRQWNPEPAGTATTFIPTNETAGVRTVRSPGPGSWSPQGPGIGLVGTSTADLLVVKRQGDGTIAVLASASPLHNRNLDEADNAALGLALAGDRDSTVMFVEYIHGYSDGEGIGALPSRARWVFALFGAALLAWLVVRGRRLGPPESADRELAPPRRLYVESVAATLRRSGKRAESVVGVQRAAQKRLSTRASIPYGASQDELVRAAPRFGLTENEIRAILAPANSDNEVLAAGRALAKLEEPH